MIGRIYGWHGRCTSCDVADRPRVIIALPNSQESSAIADRLSADGMEPIRRLTPEAASEDIRMRPFDVLVADAAVAFRSGLHIQGRARNPLAVTLLVGDVAGKGQGDASHGRTIYVTRPLDTATVSCLISIALVEVRPVRRSVRKSVNRFDASANGIPSHIVDVSAEGLRLEVPRDAGAALPPYFTVRVPLVGVAVTVRRMWTRSSMTQPSSIWYGGALSHNRSSVNEAWRAFVETMPGAEGSSVHLA